MPHRRQAECNRRTIWSRRRQSGLRITRPENHFRHRDRRPDRDLELGEHLERSRRRPVGRLTLVRTRLARECAKARDRGQRTCTAASAVLEIFRNERCPFDVISLPLRITAERHRQRTGPDMETRAPAKIRAMHHQLGAGADAEADLAEERVDRHTGADACVRLHLEPERIEVHDAVGTELDARPGPAEVCADGDFDAGHQRFRGQREIRAALDHDRIAHMPHQPDAWHVRIAVAMEARVIAADREHELTLERAFPPHHEREPARQSHFRIQQPRILGQLRADAEDSFARRETRQQREFDRDECDLWSRQCQARETEQVDVQSIRPERDGDDRDAIDQCEAGEADAGRDPELILLRLEVVVQFAQLGHRITDRCREVERLDERVVTELRQVIRHTQLAIDAKTRADARDEERRWSADRPVDGAEDEEARITIQHRVSAVHRQSVRAEAPEQHAEVSTAGILE